MRNPDHPYPLPEKKLTNGGWDTVLFAEGLQYVTQQPLYHEAFKRFRRFLAEGMKWSEEEIKDFLHSRMDLWPPLIRRVGSNDPVDYEHPHWLPREPTWKDYGGFYLDELPTLKAVYTRWFQAQARKKRSENLPYKKEKRPAIKKVA
jgi:hypothetical protein